MITITQRGIVFNGTKAEYQKFISWIKINTSEKTTITELRRILIDGMF